MLFALRPVRGVDFWAHCVALLPLQKGSAGEGSGLHQRRECGSHETNHHFILGLFVFYFVESLKEEPYFRTGRFDP